jgi:hypothetical protein
MLTPDDKLADLRRREYGTAKQIAGIEAKIIRLRAAFSARTTAITNLRREIALLEGQPAPKRHELRPGY